MEVDTFEGIYLANKNRVLAVGGYEKLSDFTIDYAEHISLSYRIKKAGLKIYNAIGKKYLVTHLKYGDVDANIDWSRVPKKYVSSLKRANKSYFSGDRMSSVDTLISLISSFTYFYFCISLKEGVKHIKKEMDFLLNDEINEDKINAYKKGITEAINALYKRKKINNKSRYLQIMEKQIKRINTRENN